MIWPSAYSQQHEILGYALHIVSSNTKGKQGEEKKIKTPNKNQANNPKQRQKPNGKYLKRRNGYYWVNNEPILLLWSIFMEEGGVAVAELIMGM